MVSLPRTIVVINLMRPSFQLFSFSAFQLFSFCLLFSAFPSSSAPPDIPRLDWQPRSDWINVKTDVTPPALGDGRADDTAPLQAALDRGVKGKTMYLPPGTYRITQTLVFHGPEDGCGNHWPRARYPPRLGRPGRGADVLERWGGLLPVCRPGLGRSRQGGGGL